MMRLEHASSIWKRAVKLDLQWTSWQPSARCFTSSSTREHLFQQLSRPRTSSTRQRLPQSPCQSITRRGAKKRTVVKLAELPQGLIPVDDADRVMPDEQPEKLSVVDQASNNMLRFPHCVLLTRVGGFYEVLEQHSRLLRCSVVANRSSFIANMPRCMARC